MPATTLTFQGINRSISDFGQAGACEELINLRPTIAGLVPVKPFSVKIEGFTYDKVYVHYTSDSTNYIVLEKEGTVVKMQHIDEDGTLIQEENLFPSDYENFSMDDIYFASMGNIMVFSLADREDDAYANKAFIWDGGEYTIMEANIPSLNVSIEPDGDPAIMRQTGQPVVDESTSEVELRDILATGFNAIQENNELYCFGTFLVAIAFKTTSGQTFWTGNWMIVNPLQIAKSYSGETFYRSVENDFFVNSSGNVSSTTKMVGQKCKMTIDQISNWNGDTSTLQSVEIYASRPELYVDLENITERDRADASHYNTYLGVRPYPSMSLGNQLLYLQQSISLKDLASDDYEFTFKFGGNIQTTNTTLVVDAGMVTRAGKMLSYNARIHYYDSVSMTRIGMPDFGQSLEDTTSYPEWNVFVVYDDGQTASTIYVGKKKLPGSAQIPTVITPSLKVKEVWLYAYTGTEYKLRKYALTGSSRYNYAIATQNPYYTYSESTPTAEITDLANKITPYPTTIVFTPEPDAMNVTEQYSPFVFRVEHSYLAPGHILDVQPQLVPVSDISTGDYPLNIFTDRGVYALLQGQGTVLYGAMKAIGNLVSGSNSVPTEHGTFIIAAGGVWVIAGYHSTLVSDALSEGPHKYIRSCGSYQSISHTHYDIEDYESKVSFEDYLKNASFSYNRFRDELIISNPSHDYSYILSLKYRQWFKTGTTLKQDCVGGNIAYGSGIVMRYPVSISILDHDEDKVTAISQAIADNAPTGAGADAAVIAADMLAAFRDGDDYTVAFDGYSDRDIANTHDALYEIIESEDDFSIERTSPGSATTESLLYDLSDEDEAPLVLIHLQSRPFSFGYQYSHVLRILDMVRADLRNAAGDLTVALYGSDNLQEWHLLTYANRTNVRFSQIRTAPAARSWRYYTLCVGGICPEDTDFGPVLVDYDPVVRRLG